MVVREDTRGRLVEKAAHSVRPSQPAGDQAEDCDGRDEYGTRAAMPARVELENVPFEGFMVRRRWSRRSACPTRASSSSTTTSTSPCAPAAPASASMRCATRCSVRQLEFDQQLDLAGWKGYYMYRNLFTIHLRYGENAMVRAKPWLITAGVVALSPLRGGRAEATTSAGRSGTRGPAPAEAWSTRHGERGSDSVRA